MSEDLDALIDLSSERLGGAVLYANDDFFAPKENLLKAAKPVFLEHEYTDRGKLMDGWESRRRRTPGFDYAIIRLGLPGRVRAVVVDTAFFRGNYPDHGSIEACVARSDASIEELHSAEAGWFEILERSALHGNTVNTFSIGCRQRVTHLKLNIFPDGGVARLRVYGDAIADWRRLGRHGQEIDLAAVENGGRVLSCSDMFFGVRHNLIMPGRAANMGDGWETKRRRGPGYDWALVELCAEGEIRLVEIDTNHFKGNYPDTFMLEGCVAGLSDSVAHARWSEIIPKTKLQAHTRHVFDEDQLAARGPFSHVRLNIYPDGGVSRLRLHGVVTRDGAARKRIDRLNALSASDAERELEACCGSRAWCEQMAAARPFEGEGALLALAGAVWRRLSKDDWLEAFSAHPRIGESKSEKDAPESVRSWSYEEQIGMKTASDRITDALADANRAYEQRFGFIYIVCATGKSAEEMLAICRARLESPPDAELATAAEEQRKITAIRLKKMLSG